MNTTAKLSVISGKHKANKHIRGYSDFYESLFSPVRDGSIKILEIGIWQGGSLKMWKEFFPNGKVFGIDIHKSAIDTVKGEDRIQGFICDQSNRNQLQALMKQIGPVDIILDDGSHVMKHQQISLATLFPFVKPGGVYCIEDVHTSNPLYPTALGEKDATKILKLGANYGVAANLMNTTHMMLYIYQRLKRFDSIYLTRQELDYLDDNVESVEIAELQVSSITSAIRKRINA